MADAHRTKDQKRTRTGHVANDRIFSGEYSRDMWEAINKIRYEEAKDALYLIGCRLQEFESYVRRKLGETT